MITALTTFKGIYAFSSVLRHPHDKVTKAANTDGEVENLSFLREPFNPEKNLPFLNLSFLPFCFPYYSPHSKLVATCKSVTRALAVSIFDASVLAGEVKTREL
jgi:hypothetical protein